jgi:hypothetical protein
MPLIMFVDGRQGISKAAPKNSVMSLRTATKTSTLQNQNSGSCSRQESDLACFGQPFQLYERQERVQGHGAWGRLRWEPVRHPLREEFNPRLLPRTFSFWWRGRHHRATDSPNAIVDGAGVLLDVIVTSQVERRAHAFNVSFRKERANVCLKARRFRHCASQGLDYDPLTNCRSIWYNTEFLPLANNPAVAG